MYDTIIFEVSNPGFEPREFHVSKRLLCSRSTTFRNILESGEGDQSEESNDITATEVDDTTERYYDTTELDDAAELYDTTESDDTAESDDILDRVPTLKSTYPEIQAGWEGFFEWIQRDTYTVPELPQIAMEYLAGRYDLHRMADPILQTYIIARSQDLMDLQNKVMDVVYDMCRLTHSFLLPSSMRFVLNNITVDSRMQTFCAKQIASVLSSRHLSDPAWVAEYAELAESIPELSREVRLRQALHLPEPWPMVHNYWGYCCFHEHLNGEECYVENGFAPVRDGPDAEEVEEYVRQTSGAEVEMNDEGTQTDRDLIGGECYGIVMDENADEFSDAEMEDDWYREGKLELGLKELKEKLKKELKELKEELKELTEELKGLKEGFKELLMEELDEDSDEESDSDDDTDSEDEDMYRGAKRRKICSCTESQRRYMLHNCR